MADTGPLFRPGSGRAAIERQDWFCGRIPLYGGRVGASPRGRKSLPVQTIVDQPSMTSASELRSGKGDRDENFPVASWIIHPRHRALILAYYNFVRTADDIADHATLPPDQKLLALALGVRPS